MTLIETLHALVPALNTQAQKEVDAVTAILAAFPGKSLKEIPREVAKLKKAAGNEIEEIVSFTSRSLGQLTDDEVDKTLSRLQKLKSADVKRFGAQFQLELTGTKANMLESLSEWLRSGGEKKPLTQTERDSNVANEYVMRAKPLYDRSTPESVAQLLDIVDEVAKLKVGVLKSFADGIGITVNGSKAKVKAQLVGVIKRRGVSHVQTHS